MILAELRGPFPFGVVLVTDETSRDKIPQWSSEERQITATDTAIVIKIQHEVDGSSVVRVWDEAPVAHSAVELGTVSLTSRSGRLIVSTASGEGTIRIAVPVGSLQVSVLASARRDADQI